MIDVRVESLSSSELARLKGASKEPARHIDYARQG
jgi:hypothetical protein